MPNDNHDAYKPAEIAALIETAGVAKAALPLHRLLTLAMLDPAYAKPGTEVSFVWGEEGGGSKKPTVESHRQVEIRAVVCPVPYVASVRTQYVEGSWRSTGKL